MKIRVTIKFLWNNKFIESDVESLSKKGIVIIYDLVNQDEVSKSWDSVGQEFNLRPTHYWNGVLFRTLFQISDKEGWKMLQWTKVHTFAE